MTGYLPRALGSTPQADRLRRRVRDSRATVYGVQGRETMSTCHVLVSEHTGASSAYVGMNRGRERNVAHPVAESVDDARRQWIHVFGRDRADQRTLATGRTHPRRAGASHSEVERRLSDVPDVSGALLVEFENSCCELRREERRPADLSRCRIHLGERRGLGLPVSGADAGNPVKEQGEDIRLGNPFSNDR